MTADRAIVLLAPTLTRDRKDRRVVMVAAVRVDGFITLNEVRLLALPDGRYKTITPSFIHTATGSVKAYTMDIDVWRAIRDALVAAYLELVGVAA